MKMIIILIENLKRGNDPKFKTKKVFWAQKFKNDI